MNDKQIERSERIASKLLRILAIIGLVAVLVLATWVVVQGIRLVPNAGDSISAAVSAVRGVFGEAPEDDIVFELEARTFAVGEPTEIAWAQMGDGEKDYAFSYSCDSTVSLEVREGEAWAPLACGIYHPVDSASIEVLPTSDESRFADVELTIKSGELTDTTLVTIVNTDIVATEEPAEESESASEDTVEEEAQPVASAPAPTPSAPASTVTRRVTEYSGPADLVINIEGTGVVVEVAGKDTFYELSPIPTDEMAAVKFTVTNRGGLSSSAWAFKAELPIEGDDEYRYVSPVQAPLAPGMQVEYTLSFDELLEENEGVIYLEVVPTDPADKASNNIDSAKIEIDVE